MTDERTPLSEREREKLIHTLRGMQLPGGFNGQALIDAADEISKVAALEQEREPLKVKLSTLVSVTERAKRAEAEVEHLRAAKDRLYAAGEWLCHLANGVGKNGRIAEGEWDAAWKAMMRALAGEGE